uniref:SAP30-binding protein n=1 Tax=Trichobilharzia regenti TaxID=157069 RepID=A0AA85K870_TRIRE|nr:unnamed protein product [Trichobilharzia regenti]
MRGIYVKVVDPMNAGLSEDLLDETEYEQIPAIYTSEDEHMRSPTDQTNTSHSSVQPENADLKTTATEEEQSLKKSTDIIDEKNDENSNDNKTDSSHNVPVPGKKRKLPISAGLVSYAIDDDEEEDDENTVLDTDDDDGDEDDENTDSNDQNTHSNHVLQSNVPATGQPPTIFSSGQPVINILSQNQIHPTTTTQTCQQSMMGKLQILLLPPEPTGHCSMVLQERVERAVRRMRLDISYDPNRAIQDNKAFRNPSIYEKLIDFLKIDEKGSNFPKEIYDPYRWGPQSYYEELAKVQNREIDRLMKLQKEQKKTEANTATTTATTTTTTTSTVKTANIPNPIAEKTNPTTGGSVYTGYIEPKRPSKWDIGMPINLQSHETTTTSTTITTTTITTTEPVKQQLQQQQQQQLPPSIPPVGSLIKRN